MNFKAIMAAFSLAAGVAGAQQFDRVAANWGGSRPQTLKFAVGDSANVKIKDVTNGSVYNCRVNGAFTVYIGTNTTGTTMTGVGYPIYANESFDLGMMSGEVYALSSSGTADVRCFEGQK